MHKVKCIVFFIAVLLSATAPSYLLAGNILTIGIGSSPNDNTGDPLRIAMTKIMTAVNGLGSCFNGSSAPTSLMPYQCWFDTSTSPSTLRYYDGSVWVAAGTLNSSTHAFSSSLSGLTTNLLVQGGGASPPSTFILGGDCTLSSPNISCTKTGGVLFGSLATLSAAPAGTLTGATLAANVIASSLTSVGTLTLLNTSGNIQVTTGSLVNVDLQTTPPSNGSFFGNAGASYQNCPLIGCLAGAHQFSGTYFKNTAAFDATKAEYMVTIDSNLNSGKSPPWVTGTIYSAGAFVVSAGNVYSTVAGGTSGAAAPTCGSGTCSDGTVTWTFQTVAMAAQKVSFFNSATTGASGSNGSWGMANDFVIGSGDTGVFKIGAEFDTTNNGLNTSIIGYNVYNILLSGLIGSFPLVADIDVFHPANGTNFAARYGLLFGGTYEASQATIADLTTQDPISYLSGGTHSSASFSDIATTPAALNLQGTYSLAAINIGSTVIAISASSGDNICLNGALDCFKWNTASSAIDFSAQGIELAQSANGVVATALTSVGPVGSHTTVQEWFQIKDAAGTVRYVPGF